MTQSSPDTVQMVADIIIGEMFAPHEIPVPDHLAKLYRRVARKVLDAVGTPAQGEQETDADLPTAEDVRGILAPGEPQTPRTPIAWRWKVTQNQLNWCYGEEYPPFEHAVCIQPLWQSSEEITNEMLDAHIHATGDWIEPHEAEKESGVEIEWGISQEDADELNARFREHLRKGYVAALSLSRPQREMFKCNCPHEVRSGCSEPKCPHYASPHPSQEQS